MGISVDLLKSVENILNTIFLATVNTVVKLSTRARRDRGRVGKPPALHDRHGAHSLASSGCGVDGNCAAGGQAAGLQSADGLRELHFVNTPFAVAINRVFRIFPYPIARATL